MSGPSSDPGDPLRRAAAVRYFALQAVGWAVAAVLLFLADRWLAPPRWILLAVFAGWVAKDLILFPFVRDAYRPRPSDGSASRVVGRAAVAATPIDGEGWVRIGGELWRARLADGQAGLAAADPVEVVGAEGLTLVVRRAPADDHP